MTSMRPPRTGAAAGSPRCPPGNSQREAPRPPGTGPRRAGPVGGKGLPPARLHHGHRPRTWPDRHVAGAQDPPGKPADRAGQTGRSRQAG
jgi:hypothetical protein